MTGASGFLGRHLLAALKDRYRIFALARRSQRTVRVPVHHNISWHQADIGEPEQLGAVFGKIREQGGAAVLVHLAAYYDFTGEDHPEYRRTNVDGLRNVLEESRRLGLRRFIFASSVAACRFPPPGQAVTEESPPDADHVYARSKRIGEEMVREYLDHFPSCVVRLGALFSDWCEYPPLFMFLSTWLSAEWNRRMLAGRGNSAIPYLHVRDAVAFFERLLGREDGRTGTETLIASTDDPVYHRRLFDEATRSHFGTKVDPVFVPRL
ncbi:MAG: NAD-dependent epimerase/dehydratase family protein, partial [Verrucomicrobiota bacterium]